jgi:hypothetical protein
MHLSTSPDPLSQSYLPFSIGTFETSTNQNKKRLQIPLKQSFVLIWLCSDISSYQANQFSMQSTPNKPSKIPRPGTMSPRGSQGSKSSGSGSFQENKSPRSPQSPIQAPTPAPIYDEIPLVSGLTQGLEDCNWEQLQGKYADAMEEHGRVEENLRVETAKLLEVSSKNTPYLQFRV